MTRARVSVTLILTAVFVLDLRTELGVAGGVPYVAAVAASAWTGSWRWTVGVAIAATALVVLGYLLAPAGGEAWKVLLNRSYAVFAIWVIYAFAWQRMRVETKQAQVEAELRESEEELRGLNRQSEQLMSELEATNRELKAFSYSVSHDLRAPLRTVDGFTQAVLADYGDTLDEEGRRLLGRVRRAASHMGELIDDLLSLAEVNSVDLRRESVDLTALARDVVDGLLETFGSRDVELEIEDGLHAIGDAHLVRVLLGCLLDNAFKFSQAGRPALIQVGEMQVDDRTCFFVRDNGAGFDMRYVDQLFQPFQRLHTADEFDGTGIGLATVRRIVDRHGGDAWAEGAVGKGATMFFTLSGADNA